MAMAMARAMGSERACVMEDSGVVLGREAMVRASHARTRRGGWPEFAFRTGDTESRRIGQRETRTAEQGAPGLRVRTG